MQYPVGHIALPSEMDARDVALNRLLAHRASIGSKSLPAPFANAQMLAREKQDRLLGISAHGTQLLLQLVSQLAAGNSSTCAGLGLKLGQTRPGLLQDTLDLIGADVPEPTLVPRQKSPLRRIPAEVAQLLVAQHKRSSELGNLEGQPLDFCFFLTKPLLELQRLPPFCCHNAMVVLQLQTEDLVLLLKPVFLPTGVFTFSLKFLHLVRHGIRCCPVRLSSPPCFLELLHPVFVQQKQRLIN